MKKLTNAILAALLVLATTSVANSAGQGTVVTDTNLYKHQWDVEQKRNLQCKVKRGRTVILANRVNWSGENLVHLRSGNCNGWTYAKNFKSS